MLAADESIPTASWLAVSYHQGDDSVAFRAAWVLEYIAVHDPDRFVSVAKTFLSRLADQKNRSCQRHFTNILRHLTSPKAPASYQQVCLSTDREQLVETVFNWFIDPQTPVAIQANCMDILLNMSSEFNWIKDELKQQIEFLLRDGSAAIQSRGKKVLAALRRSKS